jgi:hypothetical protein
MSRALILLLVLSLAPFGLARGYTPESGMWWNPTQGGTGYNFDLQDNYLGVTIYMYTPEGEPDWYIATGFLTGNALFEADVLRFENGMCFGCSWRRNNFDRTMGRIRVQFDANDPTRAVMTLGGRTFPIERYQFYLRRPEDGSKPIQLTKMLGEWSTTIDLSSVSGSSYPYSGEILVFDLVDISEAPGFFDGCRPDNSEQGFCSDYALAYRSAGGYYDAETRRHVIIVDDSADNFVRYVVQVGSHDFRGSMAIYRKGSSPNRWFPVRGVRTASRTFVEEGIGPAKRLSELPPRRKDEGGLAGLPGLLGPLQKSERVDVGIEPARLEAISRAIEARLLAR